MSYSNRDEQRKYQREWAAQRRADFLAGKSCVECGSTDRLEVDHINPKLKFTHNVWSWAQERREAELAKCQVLCYDCHKTKTKADQQRYGYEPGNTRITYADAAIIRQRVADGERQTVIALEYAVSRQAINGVVRNRRRVPPN